MFMYIQKVKVIVKIPELLLSAVISK